MVGIVPDDWKPVALMKRIHLHWTAGGHKANSTDRGAYHILVESDGKLVRGDKSIAANAPNSGLTPASHTKNANTGAIGVSLCCMVGAEETPFKPGSAPMTLAQWTTGIEVIAELSIFYRIPVTPVTILTHAEVEPNLAIPQRNKWDITRLAFDPGPVGHRAVGDRMRKDVAVARDRTTPPSVPLAFPDDMRLPRFRVSGVAPSTLTFRHEPTGEKRGELPENTVVERLALDGTWAKVRTPKGHVGWVDSSFLRAA